MKEKDQEGKALDADLSYRDRLDICLGVSGDPRYGTQGAILANYLQGFEPADQPGPDDRTSTDIVRELEDITDIDVNSVAQVLYYLGFRLATPTPPPHLRNGSMWVRWMMRLHQNNDAK